MAAAEPMTGMLRTDVELIRGGTPLLFDRQADAYYRIPPAMLDVAAFLTESMPVSQFLDKLRCNGISLERSELVKLLAFLQQNNLLAPEYGQIGVRRERRAEQREKTAFLRFSAAYLFFRLPPWRPERFFKAIRPYAGWIASKPVVLALLFPALLGYLLVVREFGTVRTTFLDSLSWAGLAKYFAAILFLKLIHEAAHSLAAIRFGCRVRGIGVGFMVFYPRLYTDTTDSWRLPRGKRLLIDAAGIITELLLGGIAALLWAYLPPGAWKSTMFYVFAVSTISTLFVNGNPFIRYDGYYIFCDLVNIENLMARSGEYVRQCWRWHFLRLGAKPRGEHGVLLFCFGVGAFLYRIFLYTSIVLVIYHSFVKAVAVVMMVLELYSILIYPCWREIWTIRALSKRSAGRARWFPGAAALVILAGILFLPLSWSISLPGETVPAARRLVTVSEGGYLTAKLPRRARAVREGDILFRLRSPQLENGIERLKTVLKYDRTLCELQQLDEKQFSESRVTAEKIASDRLGLEELERRRENLTVRAGADGVFVPALPDMSEGAYLPKGLQTGEVVSERLMVYAYAQDCDIGKLKEGGRAVVFVRDSPAEHPARITQVNRIAARLKDSPLLQHYGGPVPVYADGQNPGEYSSVLALYRIELVLTEAAGLLPGRCVSVEIRNAERLGERIRKLILSVIRREF